MNDQALKDLLDKYLNGELDATEQARLDAWFAAKLRTGGRLFEEQADQDQDQDQNQGQGQGQGPSQNQCQSQSQSQSQSINGIKDLLTQLNQGEPASTSIDPATDTNPKTPAALNASGEEAFKKELYSRIMGQLSFGAKRGQRTRKWWAVAASILLIGSIGVYLNGGWRTSNRDRDATMNMAMAGQPAIAADSASWQTIKNTGQDLKKLVMVDGSRVSLYPGSTLRYDTGIYNKRRRALYLSGKGLFDATHDPTRPFVVYSRGISTMALGTVFSVDGYEKNKAIKIDLLQGKIRIHKEQPGPVSSPGKAESGDRSDRNDSEGFKDVILQAGQYFAYDFSQDKTTRGRIKDLNTGSSPAKKQPSIENNAKHTITGPLTYDRAALATVFEDMEAAYQVHIEYNKADMNAIQFSGSIRPGGSDNRGNSDSNSNSNRETDSGSDTVSESESVAQILKKIGLLNDLQVTDLGAGRFRVDKIR